jgi:hypothetical protein
MPSNTLGNDSELQRRFRTGNPVFTGSGSINYCNGQPFSKGLPVAFSRLFSEWRAPPWDSRPILIVNF